MCPLFLRTLTRHSLATFRSAQLGSSTQGGCLMASYCSILRSSSHLSSQQAAQSYYLSPTPLRDPLDNCHVWFGRFAMGWVPGHSPLIPCSLGGFLAWCKPCFLNTSVTPKTAQPDCATESVLWIESDRALRTVQSFFWTHWERRQCWTLLYVVLGFSCTD